MEIYNYWTKFCAPYLRTRFDSERGASLVEYALLIALIAVICIGAVTFIGGKAKGKLSAAGGSL